MKKIVFNRKTIECDYLSSEIITEDDKYYYYYDKKGIYKRIETSLEGKEYSVELNYKRYLK